MNAPLSIPKPNQISSPVIFYTNRDNVVDQVANVLRGDSTSPVTEKKCVIHGQPGAGKTELCRAVAQKLRYEYSDAQIYLRVDENDSDEISFYKLLEVVIHIFNPYAQISDDIKDLQKQYNEVLEGTKALIIIDDLRSEKHLDLLKPPSSCALLVATDVSLKIANAQTILLAEFSPENSEYLLKNTCPRIDKNVVRLSNFCKNLPINLSLVAGYLNRNSEINIDDFIIELEKESNQPTKYEEGITEKLLNFIFSHLNPIERDLFFQLSIMADGFSKEFAAEIINSDSTESINDETIQACLDTFAQLNLLAYDETNQYYRMHPLTQNYALKQLKNADRVWYTLGKRFATSMDWYKSLAQKNVDEYLISLLVFDEHKTTIKNILHFLLNHVSSERDQILLDFHDMISMYGGVRFIPKIELVPLLEAMMEASIRLPNYDKLALVLSDLSNIYKKLGEHEKALDYSKLRETAINNSQIESVKQTLEGLLSVKYDETQSSDKDDVAATGIKISAIEELYTKKTKIILTGFMGTGKTTVGKLMAESLNYRFIDTDELIESRNGRSISEIFQELGEVAFREMERAIVKEIAEMDSVVISTGGRLMLDPDNVSALSHNSRVLCLVATPDEILTRVVDDKSHERPLLAVPNPKERIVELLQERKDKYLRFPQIITSEKAPADIASGLMEFVNTSPKSLVIENPHKNYEYIVGAGLIPFLRQLTGTEGQIIIITDETVNALYGPSCASIGHIIEIPSGRQHKSLATVQLVYDKLLDKDFDRTGTIVALGGSIIGDIAGYVAATYMRGVNFVQCPTSLIAMVDTSVGGKTSIDLPQGKNIIGVYKQPTRVIADVATLQTLHQLDFSSGMAEVIKHGLVAESDLLEQVEKGHWAKNWDRSPSYIGELQRLVAQAIQVKINIVQADPFEQGQRSILNLGHTFAYAIEQVSSNAYRHGEAVSMGLVAAANMSARLGFCDISLQKRIEDILKSVNLPVRIPSHLKPDTLLQSMRRDKKKRGGQLRFILIQGIGKVFVSDEVSDEMIIDTISALLG